MNTQTHTLTHAQRHSCTHTRPFSEKPLAARPQKPRGPIIKAKGVRPSHTSNSFDAPRCLRCALFPFALRLLHTAPPLSLSPLAPSTPAVLAVAAAAASFVPQRRQVGFLLHLHMTHTHTARQLSPRSDPKRGCRKKMSKSSRG